MPKKPGNITETLQVAQKLFPDFANSCFNLLRHKAIMISPERMASLFRRLGWRWKYLYTLPPWALLEINLQTFCNRLFTRLEAWSWCSRMPTTLASTTVSKKNLTQFYLDLKVSTWRSLQTLQTVGWVYQEVSRLCLQGSGWWGGWPNAMIFIWWAFICRWASTWSLL